MRFQFKRGAFGRGLAGAGLQRVVLSPSLTGRQLTSLLLGMVFAAPLIIVVAMGNPPLPYRRGQVAGSDIRARVSFFIVDEERTAAARKAASDAAPNVYRVDKTAFNRTSDGLKEALAEIAATDTYADVPPARAQALGVTNEFHAALKSASAEWSQDSLLAAVSNAFNSLAAQGCLSESDLKLEQARTNAGGVTILAGQESRFKRLSELVKNEELKAAFRKLLAAGAVPPQVVDAVVAFAGPSLKPFLFYDERESETAAKAASDAVTQVKQFFDRGDVLVRRDSLLDRSQIALLQREQEVYEASMPPRDKLARLLGMAITVSFLVWSFGLYVSRYEPRVLEKRSRLLILVALAVVIVVITRFFVRSNVSWHLIPMALFSMAVAVAYNPLFAMGYTLFLALLVGIATGGDFALSTSLFLGSIMGVLVIGRVRTRTTPVLAGLSAGIGTFVATWGTGLLFHADYDYKLTFADSASGLANGIACGALISVMLPFIERAFKVVTELSLLELADLNRPVLRRLALEAPGSYSHSLMVGTLSEAAAEAIGANALLAKAGGYYHDVGKLVKPDYFVENRGAATSRHYNLAPTMSALIIISHVKDGIEIARDCDLPPPLLDIIREHHGTTLVEYFYREAIEQAGGAGQVSDQTFRYPGPPPHTREAAIVMLADSVESAARTVTDPTPSRLESLVRDIVSGKLGDGQFDECGLTMAELKQVETSLMKSLAGIFHSRIKYPGREP